MPERRPVVPTVTANEAVRHISSKAGGRIVGAKENPMKILLAVDGSDASMSAVALTSGLATPPGSTVEVVSVIPDSFAPEGSPWPAVVRVDPPSDRDRVRDGVRQRLAEIAIRITTPDRTAEPRVLEGRPATEILSEAGLTGADLIVMGARGISPVRRLLLGSVSAEVVDHASCPVLIARTSRVDRLLFATDGSPDAEHAAAFVASCGLFANTKRRVLSVADPTLPWFAGMAAYDAGTAEQAYVDISQNAADRALAAADTAGQQLDTDDVRIARVPVDGAVASAIVDEASMWYADVLAVGTRGLGRVRRFLLGSVSRDVLYHAPMSVLIVRPTVGGPAAVERDVPEAVSV
jgi:nucleotide-binding universal stress UspA family protein